MHSDTILDLIHGLNKDEQSSVKFQRSKFLNTFQQSFKLLSDFYYRCGRIKMISPKSADFFNRNYDPVSNGIKADLTSQIEQQIGSILTADSKEAREALKTEAFF